MIDEQHELMPELRRQWCEDCERSTLHEETPDGLYRCQVCGSLSGFGARCR